jgi:hypothetical protein
VEELQIKEQMGVADRGRAGGTAGFQVLHRLLHFPSPLSFLPLSNGVDSKVGRLLAEV